MVGIFMIILDFFIVNVAIPSLQADLDAGAASVQWVVAGFGLAMGCGQITGGRLGDRYGRRRLFLLGMMLFTVASAVCGLATTSETLIAGRVAQGLSAALLSPQILSIISAGRSGPARTRAVSAYGITMGLAAACGQLIGGVLTQADVAGFGWRACFLINIPIGAAVLAVAPRAIRESRVDEPAIAGGGGDRGGRGGRDGLDVTGAVLATAALVAVVLPLVQGRDAGWPPWTWLCLAGGLVLLDVFVAHQWRRARRGRAPLVDLALFRERAFTVGLAATLVFFSGVASLFLFLAIYLQHGLGLDALRAGLVFTQLAVGYLATSLLGAPLVRRLGRVALAAGALEMAAGLGLLALTVDHLGVDGPVGLLTPALLIIGAGMGMVMAPLTATILAGIAPRHAGTASGLLATMQQVGNALGVAVVGIIFFRALGDPAGPDAAAGYPHALVVSIAYLAASSVASAALLMLLPARGASAWPAGQTGPAGQPAATRAVPSQGVPATLADGLVAAAPGPPGAGGPVRGQRRNPRGPRPGARCTGCLVYTS
ncbi:MFS transporter, partial [Frankia nepalensis]|uniref:MFS transporter n=1 Tax=Frankia nepalensis TaxID=1836974 RepID=UPI002551E3FA